MQHQDVAENSIVRGVAMCGIVGYIGMKQPVIIDTLRRLEYRTGPAYCYH